MLGSRSWGSPFSPLSIPSGIMGCGCSSHPEDDWMENIDVCENCHYPIVPLDGKGTVRGETGALVRELGRACNPGERNDSPKITQPVVGRLRDNTQPGWRD